MGEGQNLPNGLSIKVNFKLRSEKGGWVSQAKSVEESLLSGGSRGQKS